MANIGRQLRTLTVEPLQVPAKAPTQIPEPQKIEVPQTEKQPVTVREG